MSVTLINGDGNPRVLASQDADWYGALTGQKTCIIPINDNLSATITDSNTIEIGSGVCITKEGRRVQIDEGDIEEIIIPTGTQGVDTYYIIGFHLYINESGQQVAETFVETMASATDTITETTFKEGSSSIYVSLYRVKRSGLLMESVTQIIPTLKTIVDINDTLGSTDISAIGDGTVTGAISTLNSDLSKEIDHASGGIAFGTQIAYMETVFDSLTAEDKRRAIIQNGNTLIVRVADINNKLFNGISIVDSTKMICYTFDLANHTAKSITIESGSVTFNSIGTNINSNRMTMYLV